MNSALLAVLVSALVIIVGWVAAHRFNVRRDTLAKRRDLRVQYLLDAYRRLEAASNRENSASGDAKRAFESAVADVQLLGTKDQIEALMVFLEKHTKEGGTNIDTVLNILRDDLRRELSLEPDVPSLKIFRFGK